MESPTTGILRHQVILNTRPAHQQKNLQYLLESDSARVLSFPSIMITEIEPGSFHLGLQTCIDDYHIALFVSHNAVDGAFRFLDPRALPADLACAVIGSGTFRALAKRLDLSTRRVIRSQSFNSEGLLDSPELQQVKNKNILIFRGQPGRNLLGEELHRRGARVDYCEVYRRELPQYPADYYRQLSANQRITLVIFTSNEGMFNAQQLIDDESRRTLLQTPWLLISERMRDSAVKLGHNAEIVIASNASDEGIHQTIIKWAS